MTRWQLFTPEAIACVPMDSLLVVRYATGKCNIGHLNEIVTGRGVILLNQVGTHFAEYQTNKSVMFTVLDIPQTDVVIGEKKLPLD